jgi:SAM-dependent methyltransferase
MSDTFGPVYADCYDVLYHDKDYEAECDVIERIFRTQGDSSIRSVLDLGCGTGNHAIPLAQRGYEVVGVDLSADMLDHARRKEAELRPNAGVTFHQGDIRRIQLERRFDAALMMFAVLGYQLENSQVLAALGTAREHLRTGGLLIFDVWYGPAVISQRPSQRIKIVPIPEGKILRSASSDIDIRRHRCTVRFLVWRLEAGHLLEEVEERHGMRFFFPMELELFLDSTGFALSHLGAFPDLEHEPDENTWNVLGVARAL